MYLTQFSGIQCETLLPQWHRHFLTKLTVRIVLHVAPIHERTFHTEGAQHHKHSRLVHPHKLPCQTLMDGNGKTHTLPSQCDAPIEITTVSSGEPAFKLILELRASAYGRTEAGIEDAYDCHSIHLLAIEHGIPLGSLRVTRRCCGPLECEENYPSWLLDGFGHLMTASSRMCVHPSIAGRSHIPLLLSKAAWSALLPAGVRIDVSKARIKALPYYFRMGYSLIKRSEFWFGKWGGYCALIAHPAHNSYRSPLSALFESITDPCDLAASEYSHEFTRDARNYRKHLPTLKELHEQPRKRA